MSHSTCIHLHEMFCALALGVCPCSIRLLLVSLYQTMAVLIFIDRLREG